MWLQWGGLIVRWGIEQQRECTYCVTMGRSRNNCCRGPPVCITYAVCLCMITLFNQHAVHTPRIFTYWDLSTFVISHNHCNTRSARNLSFRRKKGITWSGRPLPPNSRLHPPLPPRAHFWTSYVGILSVSKGMNNRCEAMMLLWRKGSEARYGY